MFIYKTNFIFETSITVRKKLPIINNPAKPNFIKNKNSIYFFKKTCSCFFVRKE